MRKPTMYSVAVILVACTLTADADIKAADDTPPSSHKVYGEWLIRVKPDQGAAYDKLIEQQGLPLFKQAGGRMVGWWKTLIGDLYEHVTIWEYDDMAAFEKAIQFLGPNAEFAEFVAQRDPLLSGEENRFLNPAAFAQTPQLPETANFVIHEVHCVPLQRMAAYLKFMQERGLPLLDQHGFRPAGPWTVNVGKWTEVTWLFRFETLAERERLMAKFSTHADGEAYGTAVGKLVDEITTRLLVPAPFATPAKKAVESKTSALLPHLEEVSSGVFAAGFADRYRSANCGWIAADAGTLLVDLPRGVPAGEFCSEVARISGQPPNKLVLTHFQEADGPIVESLVEQGIEQILTTAAIREELLKIGGRLSPQVVTGVSGAATIGNARLPIELLPVDGVLPGGNLAVYIPSKQALFAGPLVVHGPRTDLSGSNTAKWIAALRQLESLAAEHVVPGFGSWGGGEIVGRQRRFLTELRRQVGYLVSQARPQETIFDEVRLGADYLVWMPYDTPLVQDIESLYRELTVPIAPFAGETPDPSDPVPHALVLIGDQPHEPGHVETGLAPLFDATGVKPHITVDVRALTAENLARVRLLVVLRDGLQRPNTNENSNYVWMTPEQEKAVVDFVEGGGAFLNLHNSMGLYPDDGPYLHLVGGKYIGHGPLERFRVNVVDPDHPITRGVEDFSVADEQHTPPYDSSKVHLLLQNRSDEGQVAAAGWAYEPGRGRLCHLANGHTRESLLHPQYQRLLRNAVNWCLRRDNTE